MVGNPDINHIIIVINVQLTIIINDSNDGFVGCKGDVTIVCLQAANESLCNLVNTVIHDGDRKWNRESVLIESKSYNSSSVV